MKVYVVTSEVFSGSWGENSYEHALLKIVSDEEKAKKMVDEFTEEKLQDEQYSDDWDECPYPKVDQNFKSEGYDYAKRIIRCGQSRNRRKER